MQLEKWTIFIDMLGYGHINGGIKNKEEAESFIAFMKSNVGLFADQDNEQTKAMYEKQAFDLYRYYDIKVLFVSDSVMISYHPKEVDEEIDENRRILHSANTLFIILQRLQIYIYNCMTQKNILVRGGISNKFSLIDSQFAVGEGIIEAYQLESKKAKYPRIVLSNDITNNEILMKAIKYLSARIYQMNSILDCDEDGIYYLDYLGFNIRCALQGGFDIMNLATYDAFLMQHKTTIEHHLSITNERLENLKQVNPQDEEAIKEQEKVLSKYLWLKQYHNRKIKEFFNHKELEDRFFVN